MKYNWTRELSNNVPPLAVSDREGEVLGAIKGESRSDLQLKAAIYLACICYYFDAKMYLPLSFLVIVIQEICVKIVITSITNRLINAIEHSSSTSSMVYTYEE